MNALRLSQIAANVGTISTGLRLAAILLTPKFTTDGSSVRSASGRRNRMPAKRSRGRKFAAVLRWRLEMISRPETSPSDGHSPHPSAPPSTISLRSRRTHSDRCCKRRSNAAWTSSSRISMTAWRFADRIAGLPSAFISARPTRICITHVELLRPARSRGYVVPVSGERDLLPGFLKGATAGTQ